jgi:hypothetical protein
MAPSNRNKDHAGAARAEFDEHLGRVEDKHEAAAQRSDAAFREHTAGGGGEAREGRGQARSGRSQGRNR